MTGRTKMVLTIEAEIEKSREESNWPKVIELAERLRKKSPEYEHLAHFLIGEGRLEHHLEEWPPIEVNVNRAKLNLMEARRNLMIASDEKGKKAGVALDAHLLLGKLCYACGHYVDCLNNLTSAELHELSEKKLPLRSLKIVAESFAVKGLCLQKDSPTTSKFKKAERDEEMLKCLKLSCDLGLLYMQELDYKQHTVTLTNSGSYSPQSLNVHKNLSFLIEQVLKETPSLLLQQGQHEAALDRYRSMLRAIESQGFSPIRLQLLCQLAEFLLQGFTCENYKMPNVNAGKSSVWKPKLYSAPNQFVPHNEYEESLLALLVAEEMAVRNAVLSQSAEFKDIKSSAYQDATTAYDLLTIATVRWGQIPLLQESLEHAMKFSFEEVHLWRQHALSLLSVGYHEHALAVLKQVIRLDPKSAINCLLAAKLCYEHLNLPVEGTEFSEQAKKIELVNSSGLLGKCHLYIGIGYQLQARATLIKANLNVIALDNFRSAVQLEPNDSLCEYHLGLQLALMDQISEALVHVEAALTLRPESSCTLQLFALLLTAQRQYEEALNVIEAALEEYPDCLNLMHLKAHLELHEQGGEQALTTAKQMLEIWKNMYECQTSSDMPECDRKSDIFQLYTPEISDKDTSSLQAYSTAASRVERALSEVASSLNSFSPRPGLQKAWMLQLEIWLLLAEFYLVLDQYTDVQKCIQEATQIFPLSHHIMHMRGLLHMHKQEWGVAKLCFQNAVAINPQHVKSLQQLGLVYHYLGLQGLAETTLRDAAKIDPTDHVTWYNLGKVLEALGEYETASSSTATALIIETTSPLLPFTSVPFCLD